MNRIVKVLCLVVSAVCSLPAWAGPSCALNPQNQTVTICTPPNGATGLSSPVHVNAGTTDTHAIVTMWIYVDGVKIFYANNVNFIDTNISLPAGTHRLGIPAKDSTGLIFRSSATITVGSTPAVTVSPASVTLAEGATQQFTANVAVTWSASCGTIDTTGLYTAPKQPGPCTVTATDGSNHTGKASVSVVAATVTVSPNAVTLQEGATQQFTANVAVTWSASCGAIGTTGLYTAPNQPGSCTVTATDSAGNVGTGSVTVVAPGGALAVLTYHNDGQRTGLNPNETILTPANVNSATFGRLFSYPVDGEVYAQPLFVSSVSNIAGGTHNVVYVATEHDTVYAFDGDGLAPKTLWQRTLGTAQSTNSTDFPEKGITGTPVIDGTTETLYVVTETLGGNFSLHALNLHDGSEKFGGPVQVTATVPGTGGGSVNGTITLETSCLQRAALALVNNVVFIGFGRCAHGWLLGYAADSLAQVSKFNTTPNGKGGGIWMGGGGPADDGAGNLYLITGVDFADPASGSNDAFLKLSAADLTIVDSFTPSNEAFLRQNDGDLGSGAPLVLPDNTSSHPHELVGGGKDGRVFVVDRDHMGGFSPPTNPGCGNTASPPPSCDNVIQTVPNIGQHEWDNLWGPPAYWNGLLYFHPQGAALQSFQLSSGAIAGRTATGSQIFGNHGATLSVSANGNTAGIVWELQVDAWQTHGAAILRAHDATNVATELYNSSQAPGGRDAAGPAVRFTAPTVANGHVYVGTGNRLDVYGLLH